MKVRVLAIVPALALVMVAMTTPRIGALAQTCPSPTPSCTSIGTLTDFFGVFGCTLVSTSSTGAVAVQLLTLDADGAGNISGSVASNNNGPGRTFSGFSAIANGATYCLNTDDTGYVFAVGACPFALVVDDALGEVRLIDTTENTAGAMTCRVQ